MNIMILNLHGLNGSASNTNYNLLLEKYPADMIISPQIDYAITSPAKILDKLRTHKNIDYIVGNSFGGFYAYLLSNMYHVPCLLVNPCIPPDKYIPSFVEGYAYTDELVSFMKAYATNPQPVYMILGMDDEVLSPDYTEQTIKADKLWKIRGGHSFSGNTSFYSVFQQAVNEIASIPKTIC